MADGIIRVVGATFPIVPNPPSGKYYVGVDSSTDLLSSQDSAGTVTPYASGTLIGDVSGALNANTVDLVGGSTAANVHTAELLANAATSANTASAIVKRDGSGNFTAGTITAALTGNATTATSATTATTATNFSGSLVGDVTGTQGATVVSTVGTSSAANVHAAELLANAATSANTASAIVKRDGSGNFTAGTVTAALSGNATTATTATNFSGSLVGDVTGTQGATVVATVGTSSAANVHTAELLANAATDANTASAIVKRDASGNFTAGTITASQVIDSGLTANTVPYADGSKQLTSSAVTPTELGYSSGVSSAIQTQLNAKQATIPTGTGVKFVNKNGTDSASTGNIQNPCLTIQQALTNIGNSAATADVAQPWTVFIAPGVYDEDLTIPTGRIITLCAQGTVVLGDGLGANWASTNTRNIGWSIGTADTFSSDLKPALNIMAIPASDATSTFIAEAGCFFISGNINFSGAGGLSNTLNMSSVKLAGNLVHNNVSLTNWQCYRSIIAGTVTTTGTLTLERAYDCRFNSLVTCQGYNMVLDCNFAAGMTVTAATNNLIPSGMFLTNFAGTFTGPASSLKLDMVSDYYFITNGASLAGGATKVLLEKTTATLTVGQLIDSGLTASTVPYADSNKQLTSSSVTPTELGYVSGVSSAIQTQFGNKQPLDATLTSLAAYNTNGVLVQTAADTFAGRTITGTAGDIVVTNGDGVSGNPTLDIGTSVVTLTGSQSLSNKTLASAILSGTTNANNTIIDSVKSVSFNGEVDDGNSSTAVTIDWTTGAMHKVSMTGNCTFTFTAPAHPTRIQLKLTQDATGSRTATWPAAVKWTGSAAPVLTTAASAVDFITFWYDGTNYWGVMSPNFG